MCFLQIRGWTCIYCPCCVIKQNHARGNAVELNIVTSVMSSQAWMRVIRQKGLWFVYFLFASANTHRSATGLDWPRLENVCCCRSLNQILHQKSVDSVKMLCCFRWNGFDAFGESIFFSLPYSVKCCAYNNLFARSFLSKMTLIWVKISVFSSYRPAELSCNRFG